MSENSNLISKRKACKFSYKAAGYDVKNYNQYERTMSALIKSDSYTRVKKIVSFINASDDPSLLRIKELLSTFCPWSRTDEISCKLPSRLRENESGRLSIEDKGTLDSVISVLLDNAPIPEIKGSYKKTKPKLYVRKDWRVCSKEGAVIATCCNDTYAELIKDLLNNNAGHKENQ